MRMFVTGATGQIVTALREGAGECEVITVGRPRLDLADPPSIAPVIAARRPDIVVNAAAYTAVDQAESDWAAALAINGEGAGAVARAAAGIGVPVIHISTDYVFDGTKTSPYGETDPVAPVNAYGRSKLAGEEAVAAANADHVILRTAWVYAAEGKNFLRTMLRLAETRPDIGVVADQRGVPNYAPDLAAAIMAVARNMIAHPARKDMRGIFHLSAAGSVSWADFAQEIFRQSALRGGPSAAIKPLTTADYPTPARRPANSRLDSAKLQRVHDVSLPDWRDAVARCMDRILTSGKGPAR